MSNLLAHNVIKAAIRNKMTISTAESCTGGLIAGALTDIAGSSAAFECGYVTYSNQAKFDMLGVPLEHTERPPGAVSELVASEMADGALARSNSDCAIAVTGIAGPGGGSSSKPVGLVYVALASKTTKTRVLECRFADSHNAKTRKAIREATVETALKMLLDHLE